jgi:hypothetical protein
MLHCSQKFERENGRMKQHTAKPPLPFFITFVKVLLLAVQL